MGQKRPLAPEGASSSAPDPKKPRHGFRVGPDNLPDGPWRRKRSFCRCASAQLCSLTHPLTVTKIKKELIHKAKVKKAYAKIKAQEFPPERADAEAENGERASQIHPERLALFEAREPSEDAAREGQGSEGRPDGEGAAQSDRTKKRRQSRRPGYFDKQLKAAEDKRAAAETRAEEIEKRLEEKRRKAAERERHRKAVNKARAVGEGGQRRLGRESKLLLDQVKKMMSK